MGVRMPSWVNTGFQVYAKRLSHPCTLHLTEIPLKKRTKNADIAKIQYQEEASMLAMMIPTHHVVALDERGQLWNTLQLAKQLEHWLGQYPTVTLLVGGPEGLSTACLQHAQQRWSLSTLTLPHPLVRIIVAEQLYRAWSLLNHHPYHRA
jgi:23S rRNA (pseudouridine1915-N3)-methyltransferase